MTKSYIKSRTINHDVIYSYTDYSINYRPNVKTLRTPFTTTSTPLLTTTLILFNVLFDKIFTFRLLSIFITVEQLDLVIYNIA